MTKDTMERKRKRAGWWMARRKGRQEEEEEVQRGEFRRVGVLAGKRRTAIILPLQVLNYLNSQYSEKLIFSNLSPDVSSQNTIPFYPQRALDLLLRGDF